jgi:hypothetical protein
MKIHFTKKQYEDLLKLVYLGNWMANANRVEDKFKNMDELEGYVFSHAKEFGMERWADTDDPDMTYPTRYFEEESGVEELIDDYDDENFWDELSDRLGERDFAERYSEKEREVMERVKYMSTLFEAVARWEEELEQYGLTRLRVLDMTLQTKKDSETGRRTLRS